MEIEVAKRADFVFVITKSIANVLIEYLKVKEDKISVLPNCVDPHRFKPMVRDKLLEEEYELFMVVVGYVGSLWNMRD